MKKNLLIGSLVILTLLSLSFGFVQKNRADKLEVLAIENQKRAEDAMKTAERNEQRAMEHSAIAAEVARQAQIEAAKNIEAIKKTKGTK